MTEIPLGPKKMIVMHLKPKNDQNTLKSYKITKITLEPKNDQNTIRT